MIAIQDFIIQYQAFIREDINGAGMILCGSLAMMIFIFMVNGWWSATRTHSASFSYWAHMPGVPIACALFWVFAAESYRTGAIWHIYWNSPTHDTSAIGTFADVTFWPTVGYLACGVIFNLALIRCTFLFAPPALRKHVWVCSFLAALGFIFFSHLTN